MCEICFDEKMCAYLVQRNENDMCDGISVSKYQHIISNGNLILQMQDQLLTSDTQPKEKDKEKNRQKKSTSSQSKKKQGRIYGYPSRVQVGRGHI